MTRDTGTTLLGGPDGDAGDAGDVGDAGVLFQDWRSPRRSRVRAVVLGLSACLLVLLAVPVGTLIYLERRIEGNLSRVDAFGGLENRPQRATGPAAEAQNILLIGTDRRSPVPTTGTAAAAPSWAPGDQRSDALMLVHVDADRQGASVISLPRDSWVDIPGHGEAKLNAAFSYGGPSLTVATVERLTGVRVDHLAIVDWAGFVELTDAVGGVELSIAEPTYDPDRKIAWSAGRHSLTGEEALAYVRQRKGLPGGDLDRVRRQQAFMRAVAESMFRTTRGDTGQALKIVDKVTRHVTVDQGWSTLAMSRLVLSLRDLSMADVDFFTAPVEGLGRVGDQSVVHLNRTDGAQMWAEVRADRVDRWTAAHKSELTRDVVR